MGPLQSNQTVNQQLRSVERGYGDDYHSSTDSEEDDRYANGQDEEDEEEFEENIDPSQLPHEELEKLLIPYSTRVNRRIEWNKDTKRYEPTQDDLQIFAEYGIKEADFREQMKPVEQNRSFRPFEKTVPIYIWMLFKLGSWLILILFAYACLFFIQLALFNLILVIIGAIYFKKLNKMLIGRYYKFEHNYRNKQFKGHIRKINKEFFEKRSVEVVGGKDGLWIEVQLPDSESGLQQKLETNTKSLLKSRPLSG